MGTGLLTRYAQGEYQEETTREIAIIEARTIKTPVIKPIRDDIVFGNPSHHQEYILYFVMCGMVWFIWFLMMLYLLT